MSAINQTVTNKQHTPKFYILRKKTRDLKIDILENLVTNYFHVYFGQPKKLPKSTIFEVRKLVKNSL